MNELKLNNFFAFYTEKSKYNEVNTFFISYNVSLKVDWTPLFDWELLLGLDSE